MGLFNKAIVDSNEVIRLNLDNPDAYSIRGWAYQKNGALGRAIGDFTKVVKYRPDVNSFLLRGDAYLKKGDTSRAYADYAEAVRLAPESPDVRYHRAFVYFESGDYSQAIADLDECIRLAPTRADFHHSRGAAHDRLEDTAKAQADFDMAEKLGYSRAYRWARAKRRVRVIVLPFAFAGLLLSLVAVHSATWATRLPNGLVGTLGAAGLLMSYIYFLYTRNRDKNPKQREKAFEVFSDPFFYVLLAAAFALVVFLLMACGAAISSWGWFGLGAR
jgi:tetratricopeptide (TPR) repeat protein